MTASEIKKPRICIIGTGLIGGSLALALKHADFCERITGAARTEETLIKALELGVIDDYDTDMDVAVADADIIVVCVPLGAMRTVFSVIAPALKSGAIVTDAGSAKQSVIRDAAETLGEHYANFVAGHPIAGTERSGVQAAFIELYRQRRVILTPTDDTNADALHRVSAMWRATGAKVETMSAEHHDMVLAGTSHLPHMLAFGLVDCLNNLENVNEIFRFAAGGFRDFTRIASSDPVMWRDICLSNRDQVMAMLKRFHDEMMIINAALESRDGEQLQAIFERAKKARDQFCG
jgi:prephenate dehydrogenase